MILRVEDGFHRRRSRSSPSSPGPSLLHWNRSMTICKPTVAGKILHEVVTSLPHLAL